MTVRSIQLGAGQRTTTAITTLYTVPAGFRTIIKSIVLLNTNAAANNIILTIEISGSTIAAMTFHCAATGSVGDTITQELWIVVNAGELVRIQSTQQPYYYVVSGAQLDL
jgi:hypothetical protein